ELPFKWRYTELVFEIRFGIFISNREAVTQKDDVHCDVYQLETRAANPEVDPRMFEIYETQEDLTVGDFLAVIADGNSKSLAESFCEQCQDGSIALPYACLKAGFGFEQAAHAMPDILRSDYAPFWRENVPALLITDTANFRYPYYRTPADTIDKLDFDFLTKICKATIATAIKLCN
ncbi:MAG: hypothetical protein NWE87_00050, partial [Candidatus Bathyarchaeota archaeon]|nr:hypothetical protein [Candidatus Bathyarchaeota archaeon]